MVHSLATKIYYKWVIYSLSIDVCICNLPAITDRARACKDKSDNSADSNCVAVDKKYDSSPSQWCGPCDSDLHGKCLNKVNDPHNL